MLSPIVKYDDNVGKYRQKGVLKKEGRAARMVSVKSYTVPNTKVTTMM